MSLQHGLDALRVDFVRAAPPGRAALYDAKIKELQRTFAVEKSLKTGDFAPDFNLPNQSRRFISLAVGAQRSGGGDVLSWRLVSLLQPQLRAYQRALGEIIVLGGTLVAISPQLPDGSLSTAEMNRLSFDVLSDVGNHVARSFGLVYALADELRAALISNNKTLPGINGDDSWELPLPATYVIAPDRKIALAEIELDYRERLEPEAIVAALRSLRSSMTKAA